MKVPQSYQDRSGKELYGIYRALVVDNEDPMKVGRVKVRVYSIHGISDVSDENLPWATYCSPFGSANSGSFIIPEVNNTVYVAFEGGNPQYPLYIGTAYSTGKSDSYLVGNTSGRKRNVRARTVEKPVEAINNDVKVLYKSSKGSIIMFEDTDGNECIRIQDAMGQCIGLKSPLTEDGSKDNDHLNYGMANINSTEKQDVGVERLKSDAFIILEGLCKAFIKIVTKITGKSYILLDNYNTQLRMDEDAFQLQALLQGVSFRDGVVTLSGNKVVLSSKKLVISAPEIEIKGKVTINGKSIFDVKGCENPSTVDINQGGPNGEYIPLKEVDDEYSQL